MRKERKLSFVRNMLVLILILFAAVLVSIVLSRVNDDNNPFAMAVFLLAVALIARLTDGYLWGIAASLVSTFCVNYIFTYPFWSFDITYPGYPLTMAVMLIVSVLISALTTQIKQEEQLRFEMESEKMRANLLRALAHDIRTPLAAILGASSALKGQTLPPQAQAELLDGIQRDARWLVRVTENLLSVTRISGQKVQLQLEDEVLEEIIGSAVSKYAQTAGALPVTVDLQDEILIVPMDATLIEQVLINLFDNVSAHAVGATDIWLHLEAAQNRVRVSVEDNGPGIPGPRLQDILSGRGMAGGPRGDDKRNMGIGLSVCRTVIRAHGGELTVGKSRHGGARVAFDLPLKETEYAE